MILCTNHEDFKIVTANIPLHIENSVTLSCLKILVFVLDTSSNLIQLKIIAFKL